jgi:hypothetical protein
MNRLGRPLTTLAVAAVVVLGGALPASAAARHRPHVRAHLARHSKPPPSPPPAGSGYDISYPQCNAAYPSGQAFGVVGVNGGLANNANPCLRSELAWAAASPGLTSPSQPPASLYENTADPGNGVADWPSPAKGTAGGTTPYGDCDGSWSTACAYVYGQQRATYTYGVAAGAGSTVSPATAPWWLDVETANSWAKASNSPNWAALNIATLQGFVAGLQQAGARGPVGFYSTAYQWNAITGLTATTSSPDFPTSDPDWIAGASTYAQAQSDCGASFTGGRVALAQFPQSGFDGNYACP